MSMTIAELNRLAQDTGCDLHDDCLTCPLDACKYDNGKTRLRTERYLRDKKIVELSTYVPYEVIAHKLGVSFRTVQRVIKETYHA